MEGRRKEKGIRKGGRKRKEGKVKEVKGKGNREKEKGRGFRRKLEL